MNKTIRIRFPFGALGFAALLAISLSGCRHGGEPTPTPIRAPLFPSLTPGPTASGAPAPTHSPTGTAAVASPMPTEREAPTAALPPPLATTSPTPPPASPLPVIHNFTAVPAEVLPGESVTLTWTSSGGATAVIGGRLPGDLVAEGLRVPLNGEIAVPIKAHERYWHEFELIVFNEAGQASRRSLSIDIRCPYPFFFSPAPEGSSSCPYKPAAMVPAAEQNFERGRMIWLQEIPAESSHDSRGKGPVIYVLYVGDRYRQWQRFEDTWQVGQPESDPNIVPPEGLLQPVRGFGKLWRTEPGVRERLGWAVSPEEGYDATYQVGWRPYYLFGGSYLSTADGRVVALGVMGGWDILDVSSIVPPPRAGATPTPAALRLAITQFAVDVEELHPGKRLTFHWQTTGASKARIISGTAQRFFLWWDVPPDGTLTVELAHTNYRDPAMTLIAYNEDENKAITEQVSQSITIDWPCEYAYFFTPAPSACPLYAATITPAADQPFEHGRMVWLQEIRGEGSVEAKLIFVLYDDGAFERYADTWTPEQPESDPSFVPPAGLFQPKRGFGKLWRENVDVREKLGWALAPELGFEGAWQAQISESIPGVAYLRVPANQTIRLYGWEYGSWETLTP